MFAKKIELNYFRNYRELSIEFDKGLNIICGENAQGKTNLLEALYFCATGRSHRTKKEKDLLYNEAPEAKNASEAFVSIKLEYIKEANNREEKIQVILGNLFNKAQGKEVKIDGEKLKRNNDIFGNFLVAAFTPEDLSLVKDGPDVRRKFMDMALCQIDKIYLNDLQQYCRVLRERNEVLKNADVRPELLDIINEYNRQLARYGLSVVDRRKEYLNKLSEHAIKIHTDLSGQKDSLKIKYAGTAVDSEEKYLICLENMTERDLANGFTGYGPHRDDISITVNDKDARSFGSQGQQRTVALSMKLAEFEMIAEETGEKPVLLLDDVMSELDENRQKELLSYIKENQTIITCTGAEASFTKLAEAATIGKFYIVKNAVVKEKKE